MQQITNFSIFKNKPSDNPKAPSHFLSAKIGEEHVRIGVLWTKENQYGKYLSGQLQEAWMDKETGKGREAFVIVPLKALQSLQDELSARKGIQVPPKPFDPITSEGADGEIINTDDMPF